MTALDETLRRWQFPPLPNGTMPEDLPGLREFFHQKLASSGNKEEWQATAAEWLYRLVRRNVKRGRAYELAEVLSRGRADCLGYALLFTALAPEFGVELGIVEVLVDNFGRYVPHHVNLLKLADGTYRFLDAWYGSPDIHHRRLGAVVNGKPVDIDADDITEVKDLQGLPEYCIEAITLYVKGNRYLTENDLDSAVKHYSAAVRLYPNNSRAYYNRAIAYERKGDLAHARQDYARALRDEASLIRVLASTGDLEDLIKLDERGVLEAEQDIYLSFKGFKTGVPMEYREVGQRCGMSAEMVQSIIARIESLCTI